MVFQAGGRLYLMGLDDEQYSEVEVEIVTDLASLRPRRVNAADLIQGADISPNGKRVVIEARGELFSVPARHGVVQNLSRTSGAAERSPAWSPDGKHIAYWSDKGGEYELTLIPSGGGESKTLTSLGPGFRYQLYWSPDSSMLAFVDHTQTIWIYNIDADDFTKVDKGLWMLHPGLLGFDVDWSSDSRWMAFSRGLETGNSAVFLFDTNSATRHQVTSGYYSDSGPVFDPDGKYLYYLSQPNSRSHLLATWTPPGSTPTPPTSSRRRCAVTSPSPLAPRNDEEEVKEEKADDAEAEEKEEKKKKGKKKDKKADDEDENGDKEKKPEPVKIDLDGFEERVVVLPPEAGNYGQLAAVSGKVIFHRMPRSGSSDEDQPIGFYDLEEREEETILDNATSFVIAAGGKKMLDPLARHLRHRRHQARPEDRRQGQLEQHARHLEARDDPRSAGRVAPALHRGLAHLPRLLLRSQHARPRLGCAARALRFVARRRRNPLGRQLHHRRTHRRGERLPHLRRRRRHRKPSPAEGRPPRC